MCALSVDWLRAVCMDTNTVGICMHYGWLDEVATCIAIDVKI